MPSLKDAMVPADGMVGYAPVAAPTNPVPVAAPEPPLHGEPLRNSFIRCPLPPLWQASPDALRQFYVPGQVPQTRLMTPLAPTSNAAVASGTVIQNISVVGSPVTTGGGGSSSSSGGTSTTGTPALTQAVVKTPQLPPGNKYSGFLSMPRSFQLLTLAVSSPCRVQLYGSPVAQMGDLSRALDAPPAAGTAQNIICDLVLDTAPYQWAFQNRVGANTEAPQLGKVYVTITNLDQTSDAVTLSVQYIPLEA